MSKFRWWLSFVGQVIAIGAAILNFHDNAAFWACLACSFAIGAEREARERAR